MNTAAQTLTSVRANVSASIEASEAYHEAELRSMAAFRVREAAERLATLLAMTSSSRLRNDLRALRARLLCEENDLLAAIDVRRMRRSRDPRAGGGSLRRPGF